MEYTQWRQGYESVYDPTAPTKSDDPAVKQAVPQATTQPAEQTEEWRSKAETILRQAQTLLWGSEGITAQEYLLGWGLEPHTWQQFGLGYRQDVPVSGTKGQKRAAAIVIPWFAGGKLIGIHYGFLETQSYIDSQGNEKSEKHTAEPGSKFTGRLFGGQSLSGGPQELKWLLICQGEISAMSCWQAAHHTKMDVLCIGSESSGLPTKVPELVQHYRAVIVWADKGEVSLKLKEELKAVIPNTVAIKSPPSEDAPLGQDANDLLKKEVLGGFLAEVRARMARNDGEREDLLWALYDAAKLPIGIDAETAKVLQQLAFQLGHRPLIHKIDGIYEICEIYGVYEAEPNRWITY